MQPYKTICYFPIAQTVIVTVCVYHLQSLQWGRNKEEIGLLCMHTVYLCMLISLRANIHLKITDAHSLMTLTKKRTSLFTEAVTWKANQCNATSIHGMDILEVDICLTSYLKTLPLKQAD